MPLDKRRVLLSWSSGKDSAWCLHVLNQQSDIEVVGLMTTFNESADRVAMHAVRKSLVERQAESVGLPLFPVWLPWPCPNEAYEDAMESAFIRLERTESVNNLVAMLRVQPYAAIMDGDEFVGLITRSDVLNYLRRQM